MVLVLRHRRLLVKTVISVLMESLMNNSVAAWRSSLVDPKMVMGQVGVLRVETALRAPRWTCLVLHHSGWMVLLVKRCLRGWIPVSRWTLTIYL